MTGVHTCLDSAFARAITGYLCSSGSPRRRSVSARVHCPRRRVEPCGNRAQGEAHSASPRSCAARCSVCLSSCCRPQTPHAFACGAATRRRSRARTVVTTSAWTRRPADAPRRVPRGGHLDHDDDGAADHDDDGAAAPRRRRCRPPRPRRRRRRPHRRRRRPPRRPPPVAVAPPAPGLLRSRGGDVVLGRARRHVRQPLAPVRNGAHGDQRRDGRIDDVHRRRPRGRRVPARGGHVARASRRSPTSAREWWKSQSPGDPFRRGHRRSCSRRTASGRTGPSGRTSSPIPTPCGASPGSRAWARASRPRDRRRARVADPGAGRDRGARWWPSRWTATWCPVLRGRGRAGRGRGGARRRADTRPRRAAGRARRRARGAWSPTCPTTSPPRS